MGYTAYVSLLQLWESGFLLVFLMTVNRIVIGFGQTFEDTLNSKKYWNYLHVSEVL